MYGRIVVYLAIALLAAADGRRQKKAKPQEEVNPEPQPSVLTYSTFGFNDVGSYDGFVPTSPDYSNYLNKYKETSDKLYAPAFPSAPDTDFTSSSQTLNADTFPTGNSGQQTSMLQYNNVANAYSSSNNKPNGDITKNSVSDIDYAYSSGHISPVYGSKINSATKNTFRKEYNNTEQNSFPSYQNDHKISNYQEPSPFSNKVPYAESNNNEQNFYNYATTYPSNEIENSVKASPIHGQSLSKTPKVVDYMNNNNPYDALETENKYSIVTARPLDTFKSMPSSVNDDTLSYFEDQTNKFIKVTPNFKNTGNKDSDSFISQSQNSYSSQNFNENTNFKNKKLNYDYKDNVKVKSWIPENVSKEKKRIKNPLKGYEYATNFSSTNFKFDVNEPKKQYNSNIDEIVPSSSNIVDYTNYQFSENDYLNLKTKAALKNIYNVDSNNEQLTYNVENKYNPAVDYLNKFKDLYSTVPTTSTSWGNIFKSTDYSSHKTHLPRPQYANEENYDTVHITKGPYNFRYGKDSESEANDWTEYSKRLNKYKRQKNEWNKENLNNRFKSEEDLLGLRNHDTSHPSYLPSFQFSENEGPEEGFKRAVEKWRENYIKTKYRDTPAYDYEASEAQNVNALNPYHIEVPHPVIVPVPQPYPVRVPVPKPVAVPVLQEITVPIEKPVPYPVFKRVPYPIEKLVPVPVEKQVPVPVAKPYPVAVPHIRPVYHHSRPYREEYDLDHDMDDDDYQPRPESSKFVYSSKRIKSSRHRLRRPSRMSHQERSKGRPQRRPNSREQRRPLRPSEFHRQRYSESDEDRDLNNYRSYCKRTGNC